LSQFRSPLIWEESSYEAYSGKQQSGDTKNAVIASATSSSFVKKTEIPFGSAKWLRIVAPDEQDGTELLLEPDSHPAVGPFKSALVHKVFQ
jgi:hypothetical protein